MMLVAMAMAVVVVVVVVDDDSSVEGENNGAEKDRTDSRVDEGNEVVLRRWMVVGEDKNEENTWNMLRTGDSRYSPSLLGIVLDSLVFVVVAIYDGCMRC
mmetsp:Transcript_51997/g.58105  ORF Transcript_51997/g.58105 Transcript_51997/m.58105 type:complete len:100 (-) Transcript_51997:148-447(-)